MTYYQQREQYYDECIRKGYHQIMAVARQSPYPSQGNGKQYCDFIVGKETDVVRTVRLLVDFRGEYFYSFIVSGKCISTSISGPIRNRINFSAKEAYDYIIEKTKELNS